MLILRDFKNSVRENNELPLRFVYHIGEFPLNVLIIWDFSRYQQFVLGNDNNTKNLILVTAERC